MVHSTDVCYMLKVAKWAANYKCAIYVDQVPFLEPEAAESYAP